MKQLWLIIFILMSVTVSAEVINKGHINLLALTETNSTKTGSIAHLALEIRPGSERVYLETFPMTKITTQASLRFAQQIACKELEVDCSNYDFLFSIRALPGLVGGPSAGSSATLLTAALLLNKTLPPDIAMTGTINSGGTIGPVGGLKYKVEAASKKGIKNVFLPKGTKDTEVDNKTIDLIQYGKDLNVTVSEVATIGELMELTLGIPQDIFDEELKIDDRYINIMREVSEDLCKRNAQYALTPLSSNMTQAKNFTKRAVKAQQNKAYYSAASFCFRSNVDYRSEWYKEKNFTIAELRESTKKVRTETEKVKNEFKSKNVTTLTDLQTFMAVMERVDEALDLVNDVDKELDNNRTGNAPKIGYAEERLFSSITWARFFNGHDKLIVIDQTRLRDGCTAKISEAEERYNYVKSIVPEALDGTRADIQESYDLLNKKDYIMCLYTASKSKAEADVLLNLMGVKEKRFDEVIELKLNVARRALVKSQRKNIFPIIAYSYYEYASSLKNIDKVSSLLFTEYSLELSNLDIYFEKKTTGEKIVEEVEVVLSPSFYALLVGLGIGGLIMWLVLRSRHKDIHQRSSRRNTRRSRNRSKPLRRKKRRY